LRAADRLDLSNVERSAPVEAALGPPGTIHRDKQKARLFSRAFASRYPERD